jgi:hypothetical protein
VKASGGCGDNRLKRGRAVKCYGQRTSHRRQVLILLKYGKWRYLNSRYGTTSVT